MIVGTIKRRYRNAMYRIKPFFFLSLVLLAVSGCTTPPFVYDSDEYNREAKDFGKPVTDIDEVTVCYNSWDTTPAQVSKLARAECAKYSKNARFEEQNYSSCPLVAPVAAIYACYDPEK